MQDFTAVFILLIIVFAAIVIGGVAIVAYAFVGRQRLRELAVKERIAMIEKGLMPAPELDPARFERVVSVRPRASGRAMRYRSAGVVLMGLGVALIILLTFAAGAPEVAFGVGGGLAALGAAIFLNGILVADREPDRLRASFGADRGPEPPPNIGP